MTLVVPTIRAGAAALLIVALAACASRSQEYLDAHPDLPPRLHDAILNHEILIGMTKEQVIASAGDPDGFEEEVGPQGVRTVVWEYREEHRGGSSIGLGFGGRHVGVGLGVSQAYGSVRITRIFFGPDERVSHMKVEQQGY